MLQNYNVNDLKIKKTCLIWFEVVYLCFVHKTQSQNVVKPLIKLQKSALNKTKFMNILIFAAFVVQFIAMLIKKNL